MTALVERGVRRKSAADAFLSHLSEDDNQARELARDLAVLGVDVWLDKWELTPGDPLGPRIEAAITGARFFLVLISTDSSDAARWLRNELGVALALEEAKVGAIRIIPLVSEPAALPVQLRDRFYVDLRKGYFSSLFRVAATIYDCSLADVDAVLEGGRLRTRLDCLEQLRGLGVDVWTLLERGDFEFLSNVEGTDPLDASHLSFYASASSILQACRSEERRLPSTLEYTLRAMAGEI